MVFLWIDGHSGPGMNDERYQSDYPLPQIPCLKGLFLKKD
jgi:hypothetical protein